MTSFCKVLDLLKRHLETIKPLKKWFPETIQEFEAAIEILSVAQWGKKPDENMEENMENNILGRAAL